MGAHAGTKVVRDGLTFSVDFSSNRTFAGGPAENLLATTSDGIYENLSTANATYGPLEIINTPTPFGHRAHKLTFTVAGDTGYYGTNTCRFVSSNISIPRDGTTLIAYGVWVHVIDDRWSDFAANVYPYVTGSNGMAVFFDSGQKRYDKFGREWRYYHRYNSTLSGGGIAIQYHTFYKIGTITKDLDILLCGPGMYLSSSSTALANHCPQFVDGIRSSSECLFDSSSSKRTINAIGLTYGSDGKVTFDGSSNYISWSPIFNPYNSSYSLEAWIKRSATGRSDGILSDAQYNWLNFWVTPGNKLSWKHGYYNPGETRASLTGATDIGTDWTHVALSFDLGVAVKLYVNGNEDATGSANNAFGLTGSRGVQFGGTIYNSVPGGTNGLEFSGEIGALRCYDTALTSNQIYSNYLSQRKRYM